MPDGAWTFERARARFHRAPAPSQGELERLLERLIVRITRTLVRAGVLVEQQGQRYLDLDSDDLLSQLAHCAVRYRIAVGPLAGQRTMRLRTAPAQAEAFGAPTTPLTAARDGFSINAQVACQVDQRTKLERLCRYMARGPIALERLSVDGDGLVVLEFKHPFRDGTTQVLFEPLDFIARLAALVPRPRAHLVRYHGLFAPNARHRRLVVPAARQRGTVPEESPTPGTPRAPMSWMQRLRRVFGLDLSACPRCGAPVRVLAVITDPAVITAILEHLGSHAARAPPVPTSAPS